MNAMPRSKSPIPVWELVVNFYHSFLIASGKLTAARQDNMVVWDWDWRLLVIWWRFMAVRSVLRVREKVREAFLLSDYRCSIPKLKWPTMSNQRLPGSLINKVFPAFMCYSSTMTRTHWN